MDATEFRRASHAVWEAMAPGWDADTDDYWDFLTGAAGGIALPAVSLVASAP